MKRGKLVPVQAEPKASAALVPAIEHVPHPTRRVALKHADIDEKMLPVMKWFNGFRGTVTFWCCQGTEDTQNIWQSAYVTFMCDTQFQLARILRGLDGCADVLAEWYDSGGCIRYTARFSGSKGRDLFLKKLATPKCLEW